MLWPVAKRSAEGRLASSRDADFEDGLKLLAQFDGSLF